MRILRGALKKNADGPFPAPEILIQAPLGDSSLQPELRTIELKD